MYKSNRFAAGWLAVATPMTALARRGVDSGQMEHPIRFGLNDVLVTPVELMLPKGLPPQT
jgi:hypothetical protein